MTHRLTVAAQGLFAALFLSIPLWVFSEIGSELGLVELAIFSPWLVVGLGLAFRVPAARGLAMGFSALCFTVGVGLTTGASPSTEQLVVLAHGLGLLLALPMFGTRFGDSIQLRWTSAMLGIAIPAALYFAFYDGGATRTLSVGTLALAGLGVIGLAFQRTWSLLTLMVATLFMGLATAVAETVGPDGIGSVTGVGYLAAAALGATTLPWVLPVIRKLRAPAPSW